jgi:ADP-L-glycero-D-manno-heptose 6-epimerase
LQIIVTGGAGFIGSNLIRKLNKLGYEDISIIENVNSLARNNKFLNLSGCVYKNIIDYSDVRFFGDVVFHLGARSDTRGVPEKLWRMNYEYTKRLIEDANRGGDIRWGRLVYASSAAVYGSTSEISHESDVMNPLNFYGFTKAAVDSLVMAKKSPHVVGLRFFNVYGPREGHKINNVSIVGRFMRDAVNTNEINMFEPDARRDFVHVDDVIDVLVAAMKADNGGIYNVGTGVATKISDVADKVATMTGANIRRAMTPQDLMGRYQRYTCASTANLKTLVPDLKFKTVDEGIEEYFR